MTTTVGNYRAAVDAKPGRLRGRESLTGGRAYFLRAAAFSLSNDVIGQPPYCPRLIRLAARLHRRAVFNSGPLDLLQQAAGDLSDRSQPIGSLRRHRARNRAREATQCRSERTAGKFREGLR